MLKYILEIISPTYWWQQFQHFPVSIWHPPSPQIPDLNFIQHLWDELQAVTFERARPYCPTSAPDLTNDLVGEWEQIPAAQFQNPVASLPGKTGGWYIAAYKYPRVWSRFSTIKHGPHCLHVHILLSSWCIWSFLGFVWLGAHCGKLTLVMTAC